MTSDQTSLETGNGRINPFRVVVAAPGVPFAEMLEPAITKHAGVGQIEFDEPKARTFGEFLARADWIAVHLAVIMANNLAPDRPTEDWSAARLEFLRQLRQRTRAIVLVTAGRWNAGDKQLYEAAGADIAEPAPFKLEVLARAIDLAVVRFRQPA